MIKQPKTWAEEIPVNPVPFLSPRLFIRSTIQSYLAIKKSPLPVRLRATIAKNKLKLDRAKLHKMKSIDLLSYRVSYLGQWQIKYLFDELFLNACYYFETDKERPVIFDCGSNIGMSVIFFKMLYPSARIVAFEPDPATFSILNKNIKQNALREVEAHQIALGGETGTVDFFRDDDDASSSLVMSTLRERHAGKTIQVAMKQLSSFINSEVDLLKIDVEGAEESILKDLVTSNKIKLIKRIHLEYHHHINPEDNNLSETLRLLENCGFGYQLRTSTRRWPQERAFQDISIYCYRTDDPLSDPIHSTTSPLSAPG